MKYYYMTVKMYGCHMDLYQPTWIPINRPENTTVAPSQRAEAL